MTRPLLLITGLIAGGILLLANAGGPGLMQNRDYTGSPLSSGTCKSCHTANNFAPTIAVRILDNGLPVTVYQPGKVYDARVIINASPNASFFGFQTTALAGPDTLTAGTFQQFQPGVALRTVKGRKYVEHSFPSLKDTFQFQWVAPAVGTGNVVFYVSGIAANGNNSDSGDSGATSTLSLTEDVGNSLTPSIPSNIFELSVTADALLVTHPGKTGKVYIANTAGQPVSQPLDMQDEARIPLKSLTPGVYIVIFEGDGKVAARKWYYGG